MCSWLINAYDSEMRVNLYIGFIGYILAIKNSTSYSNLFSSRDFKNDKIVKVGLWVRHQAMIRFSDIFRGYRRETLVENGLIHRRFFDVFRRYRVGTLVENGLRKAILVDTLDSKTW